MPKKHLFVVGTSSGGASKHLPHFFEAIQQEDPLQRALTGIIRNHTTEPYFTELVTELWNREYPRLKFDHLIPHNADLNDDFCSRLVRITEGHISVCPASWYSLITNTDDGLWLKICRRVNSGEFPLDAIIESVIADRVMSEYAVHIAILSGTGRAGSEAWAKAIHKRIENGSNPTLYVIDPSGVTNASMPDACISFATEQGFKENTDYHILTAREIGSYIAAAPRENR